MEVVVDEVDVVVVHVTAVLAGAAPHEDNPQTAARTATKNRKPFTARPSLLLEFLNRFLCNSVST
jgi:hypothetical protein